MNPLIPLFLSLAETLVQDEPEIVAAVQAIFSKPNPTPADWLALHQKVLAKSYADYVPASALASQVAAANTAAITTVSTASSAPISQTSASPAPVLAPIALASAETTPVIAPPLPPTPPISQPGATDPYLADGSPNPAYVHTA